MQWTLFLICLYDTSSTAFIAADASLQAFLIPPPVVFLILLLSSSTISYTDSSSQEVLELSMGEEMNTTNLKTTGGQDVAKRHRPTWQVPGSEFITSIKKKNKM